MILGRIISREAGQEDKRDERHEKKLIILP